MIHWYQKLLTISVTENVLSILNRELPSEDFSSQLTLSRKNKLANSNIHKRGWFLFGLRIINQLNYEAFRRSRHDVKYLSGESVYQLRLKSNRCSPGKFIVAVCVSALTSKTALELNLLVFTTFYTRQHRHRWMKRTKRR